MRKHVRSSLFLSLTIAALAAGAGCAGGDDDDDDDGTTATPTPTYVPVTARFLKGPAIATAALAFGGAPPVDARYLLSPDSGTAHVKWIELRGFDADGAPYIFLEPTGCDITYDRTAAALTEVGSCNFTAPPGTWERITLDVDGVFGIGVHDTVANVFTDDAAATGITFTDPGALESIQLDTGTETYAYDTYALSPFVVPTSGTPTLTFVVDMAHTLFLEKTGGVGTLESLVPFRFSDPLPADIDKVQYYNVTGTAGTAVAQGVVDQDDDSLRVYWKGSQPVYLQYFDPDGTASLGSWAAAPNALGTVQGYSIGGHLGVDGTSKMCWAMASNYNAWSSPNVRVCEMQVPAAVGDPATISCQDVAAIPAPTSGATYASGCPAITPDSTANVTLVAQ